jgi:5-methylthioadenosine/S-adenosylhomocysteine deaminase
LKARDVLEFATIEGAKACGLDKKTGSLTPGKDADLILLRTDRYNVMPMNNAVGAVVSSMNPGNIDTVMIAGQIKKRNGQMVGVDHARVAKLVNDSRDYTMATAKYERAKF